MTNDARRGGEAGEPGGTDARVSRGCTCPPEQIGPEYQADANCPLHGLAAIKDRLDTTGWITITTEDGLTASAATAEAAGRMIDRMLARRRRRGS